jgi:hypothetical protein
MRLENMNTVKSNEQRATSEKSYSLLSTRCSLLDRKFLVSTRVLPLWYMRRIVTPMFASLLDTTKSLGSGLVDANGFLIEFHGPHAGHDPNELILLIPQGRTNLLERYLSDTTSEHILIGEKFSFYLRYFPDKSHFVYAMTDGKTSYELQQLSLSMQAILNDDTLLSPLRQRLEQPRQLLRKTLVR